LGSRWAWAEGRDGGRVIEYVVPASIGQHSLIYTDQYGDRRRRPIDEARAAAEERSLWMLPPPIAFAPEQALRAAKAHYSEVRLWLHPATRLLEDRPVHRPLHAKLLLIGYSAGASRGTILLIRSATMSRRTLLLHAGILQGKVAVGLAFRLEGEWGLTDLVPELVHVPLSLIELKEREFPEAPCNHSLVIRGAVHDPAERTLTVTWTDEAGDLPPWKLTYCDVELAQSAAPPVAPIVVTSFVLQPSSAEVILHVHGQAYAVPILVTDLVA